MRSIKPFLFICIALTMLLAACGSAEEVSGEGDNQDPPENEVPDEADDELEATEPSDEELIAVIELNVNMFKFANVDGFMKTIHTDGPMYEGTEEALYDLIPSVNDYEISDLIVKEKSAEEARVSFTQRVTWKEEESNIYGTLVTGVQILRPEDGEWKLYDRVEDEVINLDENGQPIDELQINLEDDENYAYLETIMDLDLPSSEEEWYLSDYVENMGVGIAEFYPNGQSPINFTEYIILQYYENGVEAYGTDYLLEFFLEDLEQQLTTGDMEFSILEESETNIVYMIKLENDLWVIDEIEIGRIYVKEEDLYVIRYTTEDMNVDVDAWAEEINAID